MVRNSGGLARWISPGDGRPSARCGNVAVVALCLLRIEKCAFMAFDALATSKPETWNCVVTSQTHPKSLNKRTHLKSSWMLSFCWWNRCCVPRFASTLRKAIPDYSSQVHVRYNMLNDCTISEHRHFKTSSYLPCLSPKQHCVTALLVAVRRVAEGIT